MKEDQAGSELAEDSQAPRPTKPCALCCEVAPLMKSHILPNAYFKAMKKNGRTDGKLVCFDLDRDASIRLSQESWWEYLLCEVCEGRFSALERRWIRSLRDAAALFDAGRKVVNLPEFDYDSFRTFLLSILWRASISTLKALEYVELPGVDTERLRAALLRGSTQEIENISIRIRKVVNDGPPLDHEMLLVQPTRTAEADTLRHRFIFGGYVVDFFNRKLSTMSGLLRPGVGLPLNTIQMTNVPEIMAAGVIAIDKNHRGLDRRRR